MTEFMGVFNSNPQKFSKVSHTSSMNLFEISKPQWFMPDYERYCKEEAKNKFYTQNLISYSNYGSLMDKFISVDYCVWIPNKIVKTLCKLPLREFYTAVLATNYDNKQTFRDEFKNGVIANKGRNDGLAKQMFEVVHNFAVSNQPETIKASDKKSNILQCLKEIWKNKIRL